MKQLKENDQIERTLSNLIQSAEKLVECVVDGAEPDQVGVAVDTVQQDIENARLELLTPAERQQLLTDAFKRGEKP